MVSSRDLIEKLNLSRHPEGGWFRETYRAAGEIPRTALPARFGGNRSFSTAIYFLLEPGNISAFHRIKSDEIWHFYEGSSIIIHIISPEGGLRSIRLGSDLSSGQVFQAVVPAGCWFGAELGGDDYALAGCTVSPGFDFADFELAGRKKLAALYPDHDALIRRLTGESASDAGFL